MAGGGASSSSLLLSSLELSDTQSLPALNTSPPRNRCTFQAPAGWRAAVRFVLVLREVFFVIILKPRVDRYAKSMSLKYEPASELLHTYVK